VAFILAVGWLVHLAKRPSGRAMGVGATVLLATLAGGVLGTLVPTLLGGDIAMQEGVVAIGGLGAVPGVIVGALRGDAAIAIGTSDAPFAVYSILPKRATRDVMHHKRKGPKSTRSGCLLCKPHKRQGVRRITKVKGQTGRQSLRRARVVCACSRGEAR
jgi:hypothetical protein